MTQPTPTTPAVDDIMDRAARSVEAAARRSADAKPWEALVQRLAAALNCLPSSFVDGNEHLFKAIAAATARESALVAERDALRAALQKVVAWGPFPRVVDRLCKPGETVSFGVAHGSNGERDYIRAIASAALAAPAVEG